MTSFDIGIVVTASTVAAVARTPGRDAVPVLVNGWPIQTVDYRDQDALADAVRRIADVTGVANARVVVAYPQRMRMSAREQLRRTAGEAGWRDVALVTAPIAADITQASAYSTETVAVVEATGEPFLVTVLEPQPGGVSGHVAATISGTNGRTVADAVTDGLSAADLTVSDLGRVIVIGTPDDTQPAAEALSAGGLPDPVLMSPVEVAAAALDADTTISGGGSHTPTRIQGRRSRRWPRPVVAVACAAASFAAVLVSLPNPASFGDVTDAPIFALASLGLFTAVCAAAAFTAWLRLAAHPGARGWQAAGRTVVVGAGVGVAVVVGTVILAVTFSTGTEAGTAWWGVVAIAPAAVASAWIGIGLLHHPDAPSARNLWPPADAMTAIAVAAIVLHGTIFTAIYLGQDGLAGVKIGAGIAAYAVVGIVATGWARVAAGLAAAVIAAVIATPAIVPALALVVAVVVNGWWVTRAVQTTLDRHEMLAASAVTSRVSVRGPGTVH